MSQSLTEHDERQRYAEIAADQELTAAEAAWALFKQYAKQRPEVVALWSFGLGFALGWKLKIW
jgi:exonuclease V gamma subunit